MSITGKKFWNDHHILEKTRNLTFQTNLGILLQGNTANSALLIKKHVAKTSIIINLCFNRLIASRDDRYKTNQEIIEHPFIKHHLVFEHLRTPYGVTAPLVPQLRSPTDTSYFDDFENPDDMALYQEVHKRQDDLNSSVNPSESIKGLRAAFVGFTFKGTDFKNN